MQHVGQPWPVLMEPGTELLTNTRQGQSTTTLQKVHNGTVVLIVAHREVCPVSIDVASDDDLVIRGRVPHRDAAVSETGPSIEFVSLARCQLYEIHSAFEAL